MYKSIYANRPTAIGLWMVLLFSTTCLWGAGVKDIIAGQNQKFEQAFAKRDAAAIADQYAKDAQCLYDGQDIIRGKKAIEDAWKQILTSGAKDIQLQTLEVEDHKDWAVEIGKYKMLDADGKVTFDGKYLVVWKLEGGEWKIYRDIGNSNRPK